LSNPSSLISKWRRKLSELNEREEEQEDAMEDEEEEEDKLRFGEEGKMGGENRKTGKSGAGEGGGRSTTELCLLVEEDDRIPKVFIVAKNPTELFWCFCLRRWLFGREEDVEDEDEVAAQQQFGL